jgi:hypothetical protein
MGDQISDLESELPDQVGKMTKPRQQERLVRFNKKNFSNFEAFRNQKGHGRGYLCIDDQDNLNLARAVVAAKARLDGDHYATVRYGDKGHTLQKKRAKQLLTEAGLDNCNTNWIIYGIKEIEKVEAALPEEYQIKVYSEHLHGKLYYPHDKRTHQRRTSPKLIVLFVWGGGNFDVITSVSAFMGRVYWCHTCEKGFNAKNGHRCIVKLNY